MRPLLMLVLSAAMLGCASVAETAPPAESPPESVVLSEAEVPPADSPSPDFLALRARALQHLAEEDYEAALTAIDLARAATSDREQRESLEQLRLSAKRHLLQSTVADAFVLLDQDRIALGAPITGELVLVNLSRSTLSIPESGGPQSSMTTLQMEVDFHEYGVDGTLVTERLTWNLAVGQDVVIAQGARHSWPISLDTLAQNPGGVTFRTYDVAATLYPSALRLGQENFPGNLRFRARRCGVFPRNYEHLALAPRARLAEAIEKESPVHVPIAAALLPALERGPAIEDLLSVVGRRGDAPPEGHTRVACCVALRILTGVDLEADPAAWQAWALARNK